MAKPVLSEREGIRAIMDTTRPYYLEADKTVIIKVS